VTRHTDETCLPHRKGRKGMVEMDAAPIVTGIRNENRDAEVKIEIFRLVRDSKKIMLF
jgi:hypothetical protein